MPMVKTDPSQNKTIDHESPNLNLKHFSGAGKPLVVIPHTEHGDLMLNPGPHSNLLNNLFEQTLVIY